MHTRLLYMRLKNTKIIISSPQPITKLKPNSSILPKFYYRMHIKAIIFLSLKIPFLIPKTKSIILILSFTFNLLTLNLKFQKKIHSFFYSSQAIFKIHISNL